MCIYVHNKIVGLSFYDVGWKTMDYMAFENNVFIRTNYVYTRLEHLKFCEIIFMV